MGVSLVVLLVAAATFTLIGIAQAGRKAIDLEDYMVSRNQIGGPMALATVTASALGAWILFSPVEAGSSAGFGGIAAILGYCVGSAAAVFVFVFVGPRMRQIMPWGHSLNEYVRHRFGAAAAIVLSRAIVRDIASGTQAAKLMSVMVMVFTVAPMLAPLVGSYLVSTLGWRSSSLDLA